MNAERKTDFYSESHAVACELAIRSSCATTLVAKVSLPPPPPPRGGARPSSYAGSRKVREVNRFRRNTKESFSRSGSRWWPRRWTSGCRKVPETCGTVGEKSARLPHVADAALSMKQEVINIARSGIFICL